MCDTHAYAVIDGDLLVIEKGTGKVVDRISAPVLHQQREGDADEYVVITEYPEYMCPDMRWSVTNGTRVRQTYGLNEGRIGTIVGQARSRKANRIFAECMARAKSEERELTGDDFEILIDNEGALIEFDNEPGVKHWFPGQSFGFDDVTDDPNVISLETLADLKRVSQLPPIV